MIPHAAGFGDTLDQRMLVEVETAVLQKVDRGDGNRNAESNRRAAEGQAFGGKAVSRKRDQQR